jgi:hypothetical protein
MDHLRHEHRRVDTRDIPALEPHCNSWVVSRMSDGAVIGEFTCKARLGVFEAKQVRIETAAQYLGRINGEIKSGTQQ